MPQKTLLALGGSRLLLPIIHTAHDLGHRVVTADYLPDNFAHSHSDEYRNVSIVDEELVLQTARDVRADGIVSFAADPGVVAAAYAAERLGLPFQGDHATVATLQSKDRFRAFLAAHDFPTPRATTFRSVSDTAGRAHELTYPVIVKPVDAAGSKGVSRVDSANDLADAVRHALEFSISGTCIAETFIHMRGRQIVAEGFTVDGRFTSIAYMDHVFDSTGVNPYAPAGHILPSQMDSSILDILTGDLQRLAQAMGLRSGLYNIEARVGTDGQPYIMEVSPRGGGNRLAEYVRRATGVDYVRTTVQAALGEPIDELHQPTTSGVWFQQVLFSRTAGTFDRVHFDFDAETTPVDDVDVWISRGDHVGAFTHASYAIGTAVLRFPAAEAAEKHVERLASSTTVRLLAE